MTLWTDLLDCRTRVLLGGCAEPVVAAPALAPDVLRSPAECALARHCADAAQRHAQRHRPPPGTSDATPRAGGPAERPPPPRTPQDARSSPAGTSCGTAMSAAHAAGRKAEPGSDVLRNSHVRRARRRTHGPRRPGKRPRRRVLQGEPGRDVLRNGHVRRVRRRTQTPPPPGTSCGAATSAACGAGHNAPPTRGRPAERPHPPLTVQDATDSRTVGRPAERSNLRRVRRRTQRPADSMTSCGAAMSAAYAAGRNVPPTPGTSCGAATSAAYPAGRKALGTAARRSPSSLTVTDVPGRDR